MPSIYSAFVEPNGLPQIDTSRLLQQPAPYRDRLGPHVSVIKTENLSSTDATSAQNILNVLLGKVIEHGAAEFTIVKGALLENDIEDDIQEGKYVYVLNPSSAVMNAINTSAKYLANKARIRVRSIGYNGSFHMSMYYKPVQPDQQQALEQAMNANQNKTVNFGRVYVSIDKKRSSMSKVSFNKVGVKEYREYLSGLVEKDVVDIFTSAVDDEGVDEFGNKTSASMLAADELVLRAGAVVDPDNLGKNDPDEYYSVKEIESMKAYASNLRRIAAERGIVPESKDDSLFQ